MSNRVWTRRRFRSRMRRATLLAVANPGKKIIAMPGLTITITYGSG